MKKLDGIDFSDTVKYRHRSDIGMGIQAMLLEAIPHKIREVNLSDNFLDFDGAKMVCEFLEKNKTLKVLKMNNCSLGTKSMELMNESVKKNKELKLTHLYLANNNIEEGGMLFLSLIFD